MTTAAVYDPAMCCVNGICSTDVDQKLVELAADLDWLQAQGVCAQRFGLNRGPAEVAAKARHPSQRELADWAGVHADTLDITEQMREAIAVGPIVKEASAENIGVQAGKLIPGVGRAERTCDQGEAMPKLAKAAEGCCDGAASTLLTHLVSTDPASNVGPFWRWPDFRTICAALASRTSVASSTRASPRPAPGNHPGIARRDRGTEYCQGPRQPRPARCHRANAG